MTTLLITAVVSAGIGFATAALLAAGGRADLQAHIIAMRQTLREAREQLREHHRMFGVGEWEILKKIEHTLQATSDI